MKTIIDAVNELEGDIENIEQSNCPAKFVVVNVRTGVYYRSRVCEDPIPSFDDYRKVCTTMEFAGLVRELSNASWIKGASLAEYQAADKEVLKVENKTVEHNGMVYEIGKMYEFSNGEDVWGASELDSIEGSNFVFLTSLGWMRFCREVKCILGTITPAPVKLVDGAAYEFDVKNIIHIGFYRNKRKSFFTALSNSGNKICGEAEAKNITRLVPEAK